MPRTMQVQRPVSGERQMLHWAFRDDPVDPGSCREHLRGA